MMPTRPNKFHELGAHWVHRMGAHSNELLMLCHKSVPAQNRILTNDGGFLQMAAWHSIGGLLRAVPYRPAPAPPKSWTSTVPRSSVTIPTQQTVHSTSSASSVGLFWSRALEASCTGKPRVEQPVGTS